MSEVKEENYFRKIVQDVLRKDAQEEGLQILVTGSQNRGEWEKPLKDVIDYYNLGETGYNIVCMALDFAKYQLVNANIMEQKPEDSFGNIGWMFKDKEND